MLEVRGLTKQYEGRPLLRGVSFRAAAGETICLLGPSGSGKSTLLRIIAGLEASDGGQVLWNGQDLRDVPAHRRGFGLMFQDYALFPHRSVEDNVAFGLRMQNLPREAIRRRTAEALESVHLAAFARRRVTDLSGGEQQRVALARALAPRPRLLMLDEPLGALDRALREELLEELRRVLRAEGIPALYVTHDQEEAFALGTRLVLLHGGRVEQEGEPGALVAQPASAWAARFLGMGNLVPARVLSASPLVLRSVLGDFPAQAGPGQGFQAGQRAVLLVKPGCSGREAGARDWPVVEGEVEDATFRGEGYRLELRLTPQVCFAFNLDETAAIGSRLRLRLDPAGLLALPAEEDAI